MYTANTMASAIEAMGFSLPNSSAQNAVSPQKSEDCRNAGAAVLNMLKRGILPSDIISKEALENAITGDHCSGRLHQCRSAFACDRARRKNQSSPLRISRASAVGCRFLLI
jgi:hypothetical protein